MPTGRTDELTRRFGSACADAISEAYLAAINAAGDKLMGPADTDLRLAIVRALMNEAQAGRTEPEHLKLVAMGFLPPADATG